MKVVLKHAFLRLTAPKLLSFIPTFAMSPQDVLSLELLSHLNPIPKAIALCTVLIFTYTLYVTKSKEYASLRAIPGPWIASATKLWVVNKQRLNQRQEVDIELHRKYGSVVRIAPREVLFSSPLSFRKIYGKALVLQFFKNA